nr:unnamed protein product [Digitaria exilis]
MRYLHHSRFLPRPSGARGLLARRAASYRAGVHRPIGWLEREKNHRSSAGAHQLVKKKKNAGARQERPQCLRKVSGSRRWSSASTLRHRRSLPSKEDNLHRVDLIPRPVPLQREREERACSAVPQAVCHTRHIAHWIASSRKNRGREGTEANERKRKRNRQQREQIKVQHGEIDNDRGRIEENKRQIEVLATAAWSAVAHAACRGIAEGEKDPSHVKKGKKREIDCSKTRSRSRTAKSRTTKLELKKKPKSSQRSCCSSRDPPAPSRVAIDMHHRCNHMPPCASRRSSATDHACARSSRHARHLLDLRAGCSSAGKRSGAAAPPGEKERGGGRPLPRPFLMVPAAHEEALCGVRRAHLCVGIEAKELLESGEVDKRGGFAIRVQMSMSCGNTGQRRLKRPPELEKTIGESKSRGESEASSSITPPAIAVVRPVTVRHCPIARTRRRSGGQKEAGRPGLGRPAELSLHSNPFACAASHPTTSNYRSAHHHGVLPLHGLPSLTAAAPRSWVAAPSYAVCTAMASCRPD